MPSETDLLNESLSQIGATYITAIDDGSINAKHCQTFYATTRDALLRMHHWNFAAGRAQLNALVTAPLFGYTFEYPLPPDFLKMREFNGVVVHPSDSVWWWDGFQWISRYVIEERSLLTNDSPVYILYTKKVVDPNFYDAMFYQVLTTWLASKLAMAIAKDHKKSRDLLETAMNLLLPSAVALDGQEGSIVPLVSDSLTWGR